MDSLIQNMQRSVDIVAQSEHPSSKVAATLAGKDSEDRPYVISHTNHWPESIKTSIGTEHKIGNSSGTIHAETSCLLDSPRSADSSLFITDPPCPNCVKNMAEAGVRKLYIDHKGFDKDFAKRRGGDFETMSMRICEKAGIGVYTLFRKEKKLEIIYEPPKGYIAPIENPPIIERFSGEMNEHTFAATIERLANHYGDSPFACALTTSRTIIAANIHPVVGFTSETVEPKDGKYSFILQPINRILMIAARDGRELSPTYIYSSRVPTSRELVNYVGAGLDQIRIGTTDTARDEHGPEALKKLESANILRVKFI